jgi:hypothetical protein
MEDEEMARRLQQSLNGEGGGMDMGMSMGGLYPDISSTGTEPPPPPLTSLGGYKPPSSSSSMSSSSSFEKPPTYQQPPGYGSF